jgi:hypothetical protein
MGWRKIIRMSLIFIISSARRGNGILFFFLFSILKVKSGDRSKFVVIVISTSRHPVSSSLQNLWLNAMPKWNLELERKRSHYTLYTTLHTSLLYIGKYKYYTKDVWGLNLSCHLGMHLLINCFHMYFCILYTTGIKPLFKEVHLWNKAEYDFPSEFFCFSLARREIW